MTAGRRALGAAGAALIAAVIAGPARPAAAAGSPADKAEARRHFQVGVTEAQAGAYREAVVEFKRAYELSPNFAVLYNLAMAEAALGDAAAALTTFERYLAEGGKAVPADRRAKVAGDMKPLLARTGSIVPHVTPVGAGLMLDGAALDRTAAGRGVRVNVGAHTLAAAAEGYLPAEQAITVASGDVANVTLALAPVPPPRPEPAAPPPVVELPPPPVNPPPAAPSFVVIERPPAVAPARSAGSVQRTFGYLLGVAGLAGLATGGALYAYAWTQAQSAVNNGCTEDLGTCRGDGATEWQSAQSGVRNARIAAAVGGGLFVAGAVIVVAAPSAGAPAGIALAGRW
jgi:tetratricopeptide (TPR) repeat protein